MKSVFDQVRSARAECVYQYLNQPDHESTELISAEIKTLKSLFPAVLDRPYKVLTQDDFNLIHVAIVQINLIIAWADYNYADIVNKAPYVEIHVELKSPYHIHNLNEF